MIVDKINKYLTSSGKKTDEIIKEEFGRIASHIFERQVMQDDRENLGTISLSQAGDCARKLGYQVNKHLKKGKIVDSRAKMVFLIGDITEMAVIGLMRLAGLEVRAVGTGQEKVAISGLFGEIEGHPDGFVNTGNEEFLLEIKSMSSYAFEAFEKGILDEKYVAQINAYMEATGKSDCWVVALNKDAGVLAERRYERDQAVIDQIKARFARVMDSKLENAKLPPREHEPTEGGMWPWQCAYCPYHVTCLIEPGLANKVVVGKSYKLKAILEKKEKKS